ncbi:hypothetical protein CALCODRAFT_359129 [Calocera cornea HHB12733]|uniref:F-box domain-containing protein n=1 Tax=Calocera cornea HHB12733 TaxID=1353952 RepID=A0A165ENG4_9BASI|nr:hypothetical protein CALCODRAFT_359129 [Calocera cornea HHB12733]
MSSAMGSEIPDDNDRVIHINQLPTEILQDIFAYIQNDGTALDDRLRRSPVNLLQVDHHWRKTTLFASWFWAALEFPFVASKENRRALIDLAIARMSAFPDADLHPSLESAPFVRAPRRDRSKFTIFLRDRRVQWRSLYLERLDDESESILFKGLRMGGLPRLWRATLCGQPMDWAKDEMAGLAAVLGTAIDLRELTLERVIVPPTLMHLFLDLSRCVQDDSMRLSAIAMLLSMLKKLETLKINRRLWVRADTFPGLGAHLPSLRTLVLRTTCHETRTTRFLNALHAPSVQHVQYHVERCGALYGFDELWVPSLLDKHWKLETLDALAGEWPTDDQIKVFRAQQELKCIVIHEGHLDILLKAARAGEFICPALEELCVLDGGRLASMVLDLVELRAASPEATSVRKVRLLPARNRVAPPLVYYLPNPFQAKRDDAARASLMETVDLYTTWNARPYGFYDEET